MMLAGLLLAAATMTSMPAVAPPTAEQARAATALRAEYEAERASQYARWKASGLQGYDLTLEDEACHCQFGPYYGPLRVSVRDGRVVRAIYLGPARDGYARGDRVRVDSHLKVTVEQLFELLERRIAGLGPGTHLTIAYDATWGFPTLIDFDQPDQEDEQSRLVVSDLVPVAPKRPKP
jgi:hypothetical protein